MGKEKLKKGIKAAYYLSLCSFLNPKNPGLNPYKGAPIKKFITQKVPGNHQSVAKLVIKGKINGVGYKKWLKRQARLQNLECYFYYNTKDQLNALIIGDHEKIEMFIKEAWKGNQKSKVKQIKDSWFNKPIKGDIEDDKQNGKIEEEIGWSQNTVDLFLNTLEYLKPILQTYNEFEDIENVSNSREIERGMKNRQVPGIRIGNLNYFMLKDKYVGTQNSLTSNVNSIIRSMGDHKQLTKDQLNYHGVPTPKGEIFTNFDDALQYFETHKHPFVVKPIAGSYGNGVTVDVRTKGNLKIAWNYAKQFHEQIVLEEMVNGIDLRVLIAGGKAVAALLRVPANVVGDGEHTIKELIDLKNAKRLQNPRLKKALILEDGYTEAFIKRQGHTFDAIPKKDETIFLHLKANISAGADSIGVMEYMHPDLLLMAEEAAAAFGVVDFWGVDLLVERLDLPRNEQNCKIIEMNSRANIYNVQFPMHGQPRDAAQALVDYFHDNGEENNPYLENVKVQITGIFPTSFMVNISETAREFFLEGIVQKSFKEKSIAEKIELILSGQKNHMISFLDLIRSFRNHEKGVVDGLEIYPKDIFRIQILKEDVVQAENSSNGGAIESLNLDNIPETQYEEMETLGSLQEDNTRLFQSVLEERGYQAEPLYEELLKIKHHGEIGITGTRHSSIFCDTVAERLYPLKEILSLNGLPIARGIRFKINEKDKGIAYFNLLKKSCTATRILPEELYSEHIAKESALKEFWERSKKKGASFIYLEEKIKGYRICVPVVKHKAHGALIIEPTRIIGQVDKTIKELIEEKNNQRKKNLWYSKREIHLKKNIIKRINDKGYVLEDVLPAGESIQLENSTRFPLGGETIDINNSLDSDFKKGAIQAVQSIPGLDFAFVYLIVPKPNEAAKDQRWVIDFIDTNPQALMFHYPWKGNPYNLVEKVVDDLCLRNGIMWMGREDTDSGR